MKDEVRQNLKKIGQLQRKIIIWLGNEQGVTTIEELMDRWDTHYPAKVSPLDSNAFADALSIINADFANTAANLIQRTASREPPEPTPYAPYLTYSYFEEENEEESLLEEGWIRWNPKEIIDEELSQAKSASFSKSIRGLEDRDLIKIAKVLGKKQRISHVKLTFKGEVASVLLRQKKYKN